MNSDRGQSDLSRQVEQLNKTVRFVRKLRVWKNDSTSTNMEIFFNTVMCFMKQTYSQLTDTVKAGNTSPGKLGIYSP